MHPQTCPGPTPKIFCTGFQKTGTTSLAIALESLGYRVVGYHPFRDLATRDDICADDIRDRARTLLQEHDVFKDTPWPVLFKDLDQWCPGSRFIHVERDVDRWIASALKDFQSYPNEIHRWIYGCPYPLGHEQKWIDRYCEHNAEVREYFKNRPEHFLSLHLDKGEVGWEAICRFLDKPIPDAAWPHANRIGGKRRRAFLQKIKRRIGM